jgi:predicted phage-related endonuclease
MYMRLGRLFEKTAEVVYQEQTGNQLEDPGDFTIFWGEREYQFATVDRIDRTDNIIVEFKSVGGMSVNQWKEDPPLIYQIQVQHYLNVLKADRARIGAIFGAPVFDYQTYEIDRDDRFIEWMNREQEKFWNEFVEKDIPPPVSHLEIETKALNHSVSDPFAERHVDYKSFLPFDRELIAARDHLKSATERYDLAANKIRALMGRAESLLVNNQLVYTFKEDVVGCRRLTRKTKGDLRP